MQQTHIIANATTNAVHYAGHLPDGSSVQAHSAGDIYPYVIAVRGCCDEWTAEIIPTGTKIKALTYGGAYALAYEKAAALLAADKAKTIETPKEAKTVSIVFSNETNPEIQAEAQRRIIDCAKFGISQSWGVRAVFETGRVASLTAGYALELFETVSITGASRQAVLLTLPNTVDNLHRCTGLCHDFAQFQRRQGAYIEGTK